MKKYSFLIVDTSNIYELPVACFENLNQCSEWLGINYHSTKNAVCYNLKIHGRFRIEKVINIE